MASAKGLYKRLYEDRKTDRTCISNLTEKTTQYRRNERGELVGPVYGSVVEIS